MLLGIFSVTGVGLLGWALTHTRHYLYVLAILVVGVLALFIKDILQEIVNNIQEIRAIREHK